MGGTLNDNPRTIMNGAYLTIIPWARVGYEMIDSASGIIVLLKTPRKYSTLDYNKNKKAQKSRIRSPFL